MNIRENLIKENKKTDRFLGSLRLNRERYFQLWDNQLPKSSCITFGVLQGLPTIVVWGPIRGVKTKIQTQVNNRASIRYTSSHTSNFPSTYSHFAPNQDPSNQPCGVANKLHALYPRNILGGYPRDETSDVTNEDPGAGPCKILHMTQVMIHPMLQSMSHFITQGIILLTFQSKRHTKHQVIHQSVRQYSSHHKCQHNDITSSNQFIVCVYIYIQYLDATGENISRYCFGIWRLHQRATSRIIL